MKIINTSLTCVHHTAQEKSNFIFNGNRWYDRSLNDWAVFFDVPIDTFITLRACFSKLESVANNTKTFDAAKQDETLYKTLDLIRFNYCRMTEAIIAKKKDIPSRLTDVIEDFDNYYDLWNSLPAESQKFVDKLYLTGGKEL